MPRRIQRESHSTQEDLEAQPCRVRVEHDRMYRMYRMYRMACGNLGPATRTTHGPHTTP